MRSQSAIATAENPVVESISWSLNVPSKHLFPYTHFVDDLHLDQFDMTLLIARLESQFKTYLTLEQVATIETVADLERCFA